MMSRDVAGKEIVQVETFSNDKQWLYRDQLNEVGRWYVDHFENTVKMKSTLAMPIGNVVPVDKLPERHRPKYIKGVDIVDPDDREPADPVWLLMSFVQMLEEYRDRKDYFAISVCEMEEANARWQETDETMKQVTFEDYNGIS